ncbi:hypothetical protein DYB26_005944 [Aphanomyces astaci]|uniref:Uncharacterized protein n=1 Tax=Aphanomyces astaci TaxID=112090 RepID=A0A397AN21_APHAT|nr:hypothetical protein DYB36_002317 [Aphanomyces astaci]RHY62709.1 hypothetical protein DYB38_002623 [Aphanomyces astaci]RHZ02760.1 hypothetical protein DYB31_015053 [Aphanomyces astaci]RHZ30252.1 hypothetical protein DYB26_005944 [Aphanomyces astaci]
MAQIFVFISDFAVESAIRAPFDMKYEESHALKRYEVRVNVKEMLAVRTPQTTLMVTLGGEHHHLAMDHISNLLMEKHVLHSVVTHDGRKTLIVVDDMPSVWSCAMECGVTVNIHREKGPMSSFVVNALSCALVLLQVKASGSVHMGQNGTFTMNKQLRPDEVQCVQIHDLRLVGQHVVMSFSPVVYAMKTADTVIREMRANQGPLSDDKISQNVVTNALLYAIPGMNECRILRYSTAAPPPTNLMRLNLARDLCKFVPQTEAEFRSYWKGVHRIHLPNDFGGYLRVQFASGDEFTYPSSCVATNFHILHKQSRLEAQDIARMLLLTLKAGFGKAAVAMHDDHRESKTAQLLPASALMGNVFHSGTTHADVYVVRKRPDSPSAASTKRRKGGRV